MKYTVTAPITLGAGLVVGLSDAQAGARAACLHKLGTGRYEIRSPIQFKAGEVFHSDDEMPKAQAEAVESRRKKTETTEPKAD